LNISIRNSTFPQWLSSVKRWMLSGEPIADSGLSRDLHKINKVLPPEVSRVARSNAQPDLST